MVSIPAELVNLFTFVTANDYDNVSILWDAQPRRVNESLPATNFLLACLGSLPGWTLERQISEGDAMFWGNDKERAILMIRGSGVAELRLHDTEDQYLGAWKYLYWIMSR